MKSLYGQYILEREAKEIIETEHGFATYQFLKTGECYLQDIFVASEYRNSGLATTMADRVTEIAKEHGCKILMGSVYVQDKNATRNMKVLLSYGMSLHKNVGDMIFLTKSIGD